MDDCLCCPDCGTTDFKQVRVAQIEYTVQLDSHGGEHDVAEEVQDGGDRDTPLRCDDCGAEYENYTELSTMEAYSNRCPSCDGPRETPNEGDQCEHCGHVEVEDGYDG